MERLLIGIAALVVVAAALIVTFGMGQKTMDRRLHPFLVRDDGVLKALAARYGTSRNSEFAEEWIVRDFFGDRREGVFVDVGANDYRQESNTYYLETELGWSGLAIEPQRKYAAGYAEHRPRSRFIPVFLSDVRDEPATLYVPPSGLRASSDKSWAESGGERVTEAIQTVTTTLDDVLDLNHITAIDFLSIDVELHEPQVLKGFSIDRYRPRLVCVEVQLQVRQAVLDYFTRHRYVIVGKYLRADSGNLWLTPLES